MWGHSSDRGQRAVSADVCGIPLPRAGLHTRRTVESVRRCLSVSAAAAASAAADAAAAAAADSDSDSGAGSDTRDTGELICRNTAMYGNSILNEPMNENAYVIGIPPCLWGDAAEGLHPPSVLSLDSNLTASSAPTVRTATGE